MCSLVFQIDAHQLECQHIREYSRATAGHQSTVLQLAVKEYRPLDNLNPSEGDITIIGAHANGFPKEMYEPLWESLYHHLKRSGTNIRAIWIADVAHQGHSGVLNEHLLGNDPSGFDHSRDLLQMVNHFRAKMPRPIVGVGHSMGGCQLVQLSLIHPRLLSTLVLLDPVIQPQVADHGPSPTLTSTFRRDVWPSRAVAEVAFSKNKVYQQWHPHVFEKWKEYGLREDPTALIPNAKEGHATTTSTQESSVTLSTTKHQEVFTYLRPYHASASKDGVMIIERAEAPDLSPSAAQRLTSDKVDGRRTLHFYRPEQQITYLNLPHLRPSVLYIFGGKSDISQPQFQDAKMAATGSGVGGSGGAKEGKVAKVVLENAGHLVPFEEVDLSAMHCAQWLHTESEMVREEDAKFYKWWGGLSLSDKTKTGDDWREYMMKERKKMEKL